jgi:hypothetical protein
MLSAIARPVSTPAELSRAKNLPICRRFNRPSSSVSSTPGPPKRSTSTSQFTVPTRADEVIEQSWLFPVMAMGRRDMADC